MELTNENFILIRNPAMIDENERLNTFKNWRFKRGNCTKDKMAKAGFFKVGKEDNDEVRCFVCLNVFEHWDRGDDPFKEHGSLYPDCHFAILQKEQADFTVEDWIRIMNQRKIILNELRIKMKLNELTVAISDSLN
ncbi:hypothetical protein RDWZM_000987 [Blomia tropicalis]|uniref:Uncharacterized protein n=1 Tax=Blomia tropicalis TaxID=40697 RepID=A0A9Q0MBD6_BLOTA|nr:hypothetical protein RDWZM_000987 [Blomia tropicalis]